MKKILFITDRVMHYQIETFRTLEKCLNQNGFELWLLSGEDKRRTTGRVGISDKVIANEVKFSFMEIFVFGYKIAWYEKIIEKIKGIEPAIVVNAAHSGNLSHWQISRNKNRLNFQLVSWLCGYEFHPGQLKKIIQSKLIRRYDYHLAYHTNAQSYAMTHGSLRENITIIHNTINEQKIVPMSLEDARARIIALHPEIGSRQIILYVGAVLQEKRIEIIFDALNLLHDTDAVFVLVGDGEHLPAIQALAGGRKDVVFAGRVVAGVEAYFDSAAMYVLPGTGGLGINEAMAHALPVVSGYADGSADDLVIDGETGFRLKIASADELADRMRYLLEHPNQARAMGKKGELRIRGELSFEKFINRSVSGLQSIFSKFPA